MLSFPTRIHHWIVPVFIATISIVGFFFEPQSHRLFALTDSAFTAAEFYRLITGHFLHTNDWHLVLNLLGLALLWALHGEYYHPRGLPLIWLFMSAATGYALLLADPQMQYVGLSGVLHGLFVWGACKDVENREKTGWLLLIGITIKVAAEQFGGDTSDIANLIDASVAIDAHLFGAFSGLGIFCLVLLYKKALTRRA